MAYLVMKGPRAELIARTPSSLRGSLREHTQRGTAFLILSFADWDEELPAPRIVLDDIEKTEMFVAPDLDAVDEVIAASWGVSVDQLHGNRPVRAPVKDDILKRRKP